MVGGTIFHREMIPREISRALVLNLSGETSGAKTPPRRSLPLTEPSLLSRATRLVRLPYRPISLTNRRCYAFIEAEFAAIVQRF